MLLRDNDISSASATPERPRDSASTVSNRGCGEAHPGSLIELAPPTQPLDEAILEKPGAFLWWYADLLDARGNGLVLIWSFGLPFLPGYANSARRGAAPPAKSRPSLNVALYREGQLDCYLLQECDPGDVKWDIDQNRWQFGSTQMRYARTSGSETSGSEKAETARLEVDFDCPVPSTNERLNGRLTIEGVARQQHAQDTEHARLHHDWSPLCGPAGGFADLRVGRSQYRIEGRGYLDRNSGPRALDQLGIQSWMWGRYPFEDREMIFYLLWPEGTPDQAPEAVGLTIDCHGQTQRWDKLEVEASNWRRAFAGMPWPKRLGLRHHGQPWLDVEFSEIIDNGPFYLRFFSEAHLPQTRTAQQPAPLETAPPLSQSCTGFAERCIPSRVDLDRHRPLVRMRVHHAGLKGAGSKGTHSNDNATIAARNSMWLPLFSGPRIGRWRRLLKLWS